MAIIQSDFDKIWASQSPLTPYQFTESQYKEGWNFVGGTPPSRQMWDFLQKNNDEKMQYLADNYLPLSGGTMTGTIKGHGAFIACSRNDFYNQINGGIATNDGAKIILFGKDEATRSGRFFIDANDGTNYMRLAGYPDGTLTWNGQPLLPVGIVQAFAGTTIPNGWLLCDGSAVSRTTYANLFACIGTTYGAGNGSTTFNLPNLVDKFIEGSATAGTVKNAGLPNITGSFKIRPWGPGGNAISEPTGVYTSADVSSSSNNMQSGSASYANQQIDLDASRSNSIYGNSTTVQPPALTMRYIIKY